MELTLLGETQTETSAENIICPTFPRIVEMTCEAYTGSPVQVQLKRVNESDTEWRDCVLEGQPVRFEKEGDTVRLPISPGNKYRCLTERAGAKIVAKVD